MIWKWGESYPKLCMMVMRHHISFEQQGWKCRNIKRPPQLTERITYKRDIVEWCSPIETFWLQKTVSQEMGTNETRILTTTNGTGGRRRLDRGARQLLANFVRDAPFSLMRGPEQYLTASERSTHVCKHKQAEGCFEVGRNFTDRCVSLMPG